MGLLIPMARPGDLAGLTGAVDVGEDGRCLPGEWKIVGAPEIQMGVEEAGYEISGISPVWR